MKIEFDDKSYIECKKNEAGNILILIQAKDQSNPLKKIINSCELTLAEFKKLILEIT
jgi:tRNA threonylcarbamoyladenosine modification (KEOPS) complex  Pcc1 subunit